VTPTTDWTFLGSNPGGGEIFCACPDQTWGPPSLLYNGYRVPGVKRLGRAVEVEGRVELYICSPSGAFMACSRVNFTFTLYLLYCQLFSQFIAV